MREEYRLRMFETRALRRIFGLRRDEVTGEWRKLHNEELNDLYFSPHIIRVIKLGRMRWVGHVNVWGKGEVYTGFWWGNLRKTDHMKEPGVDGKTILRWIFRKWDGGHGLDRSGSGQGQVAGTCKCGNEPAGNLTSCKSSSFSRTLFRGACK
jgi:hypothetical protein